MKYVINRSLDRLKTRPRAACLVAAAAASVIAVNATSAQELKFSHGSSETHIVNVAAAEMAEAIDASTEGSLTMAVFPNHQLGEGSQVTEQITLGAELLTIANAGALAEYVPDYGVLQFPFLFNSYEAASPLLESELFGTWRQQLADGHNIHLLCVFNFGVRDLFTVNTPVRSPADLAGHKVRVQPVPLYLELVSKSFKAVPTPMPYAEVYSALSQGVIDAAEAPPASILDRKFFEVAGYLSLTSHIADLSSMIMSKSAWDGLDETSQAALAEAAQGACDKITETSESSYQEAVSALEANGMTVIRDVDIAAFQEGAAGIVEAFPEWTPGLLDSVKAALADGK